MQLPSLEQTDLLILVSHVPPGAPGGGLFLAALVHCQRITLPRRLTSRRIIKLRFLTEVTKSA